MVSSAACKWFLSRSQAATTWQSLKPRKASVLPGPIMPQPTTPMVIRSEGAVVPARPKALAGMMVGTAMAAPVAARKRRREMGVLNDDFIVVQFGQNIDAEASRKFRGAQAVPALKGLHSCRSETRTYNAPMLDIKLVRE